MLDYENDVNPYDERRDSIAPWADIANEYCPSSDEILSMGKTDKKLLNKSIEGIKIVSPIDFVNETED
jgi:hypothetical protein